MPISIPFPKTRSSAVRWLCAGLLACCAHAHADWDIPAGAVVDTGGGATTLGCTDLRIGGTLTIGPGGSITEVRDVFILPGGSLQLAGGTVQLAAQWVNQGSFSAGGGQVVRVNNPACPAQGPLGVIDTGASTPIAVPALGEAALAGLAACLCALAWRNRRRSRRAPASLPQ